MAPASVARRVVAQHKPAACRRAGDAVGIFPPRWATTHRSARRSRAGCPGRAQARIQKRRLTMLALMPLLEEAGVPAGWSSNVIPVVAPLRPGRSPRCLHDPRVRVVSFTLGSTEVGRKHVVRERPPTTSSEPVDGARRQRAVHRVRGPPTESTAAIEWAR